MGTALYIALVHCNVFSNYSFTVLRSALLRETMMGTHLYFPSSNGAEQSAFDSDGNIAISRAIQYFPFPLRSAPYQNHCYVHSSNGAERSAFDSDGNIAISRAIQYFPFPIRSAPCQNHCYVHSSNGAERIGKGKY